MSNPAFKNLIETIWAYDTDKSKRQKKLLDAVQRTITDPFFAEHEDLYELTPRQTSQLPNKQYPNGLYSLNITKGGQRRLVIIVRTSEDSHIYLKMMLQELDYSTESHRLAYVTSTLRFPTIHHDLERGTIYQVKRFLEDNGIEL